MVPWAVPQTGKGPLCFHLLPQPSPAGHLPQLGRPQGFQGEDPFPSGSGPHVPSTRWHLFFKFLLHSSRPQVPQWPGLPPCPFIAARTFQIPLHAYRQILLARLPSCTQPLHFSAPTRVMLAGALALQGTVSAATLESWTHSAGTQVTSLSLQAKVHSRSDHTAPCTAREDADTEEPQAFDSGGALGWRCPGVRRAGVRTGPPGRWPLSDLGRLRPGFTPGLATAATCPHSSPQPPGGTSRLARLT